MFPFDEDDEGEVSFGESSDAERKMTPKIPKAPSVKTFDDGGNFEGASDVDSGTLRAFVVAVIYANVAVLFVALGPMVWYFEGWSRIGPALFVVGLLAGIRTYQTYRAWERSKAERDSDETGVSDTKPSDTKPSDTEIDDSERADGEEADAETNADRNQDPASSDDTPPTETS